MYRSGDVHPDYCRHLPLIIPEDPRLREDAPSYVNEIVSALAKDDSKRFMKILLDKLDELSLPEPGFGVTRPLLLKWAMDHRAIRCAESLFSLPQSPFMDCPTCGLSLLHWAATEFLPNFVKLILEGGSTRLHSHCDNPRSEYYLMIPIEAALEKLRKKILWTPTQSVYRLIFALCGTKEMEQASSTICHLMRASSDTYTMETIYYYANLGKIIELAALLYVDGISKGGLLKGFSDDEFLELKASVATNILSCSREENYFAVDGCGVALSLGKKRVMMSILLLLDIFYRTKFSMLGFNASPEILAKRMKGAGFDWAADDDLQYMGNVHATEVFNHHKTTDDRLPPVLFSTMIKLINMNSFSRIKATLKNFIFHICTEPLKLMRMQIIVQRSTSASHFPEKRLISTFQASKSVSTSPVMPKKGDEPQCAHRYRYYHVIQEYDFPEILSDEDVKHYVRKIFKALKADNSAKFVKVVNDETRKATFASFEIAPSLFGWAIFYRAVRCAEAMLSGKTGQSIDLNVPPNVYQPLPIHLAATKFLPEFVNLLVKYGARLDIPSEHLLPLDACLEKLRENILWTPAYSVYELIYNLCPTTEELEEAYLTISNIMRAMPVEQVRQTIWHYILHQKMVEFAVLLYVDAISNLGVFKDLSLEYLALCKFAAANILSHPEMLPYFLVDENGRTVSSDKKRVMKSMMQLFKIFRRTDFSMLGFNSGRIDLQNRIQNAGFDLITLQNPGDAHATGVGKYPEAGEYSEEVSKFSEAVNKYPEVFRHLEPMADPPRDVVSPAIWALRPKRIQISHQRSVFASSSRGISSAARTFPAAQSFKSELVPMSFTPLDGKALAMKATRERLPLFSSSLRMCSVLAAAIRKATRV